MSTAPGRRAERCPQGHPYEGYNLFWERQNGRFVQRCRACHNQWMRAVNERARARRREER